MPIPIIQVHNDAHVCQATRMGDSIIFTCPHCEDYMRTTNIATQKSTVTKNPNNHFQHIGNFVAPGIDHGLKISLRP